MQTLSDFLGFSRLMSDTAITVENLSKRYLIGHRFARRGARLTLREVVEREARNFTRKLADFARGRQIVQGDEVEEFWALKNISFDVKQGEALGIIGPNGAGKSTLLKILSRITEPTQGRVKIRGRVASLLEVGTGFHSELTGRENIYLNGAILGMTRTEIKRKFDEIVAFAEVEEFLDTPVKRYSSGMYVRLAFAVAAHLEPEILIVDEVLAVGDAAFQKKCLGKMSEVARQSRTVLFVSHNMGAIRTLTQKCILLEHGCIAASGNTENVIAAYLAKTLEVRAEALHTEDLEFFRRSRKDSSEAKIVRVGISGPYRESDLLPTIELGAKFTIEIHLAVYKALHGANVIMIIKTSQGEHVAVLASWDRDFGLSLEPGHHIVKVRINDLPLSPGRYFLDVGVDPTIDESCDVIFDYPLLSVVNDGQVVHWLERPWGVVHCQEVEWNAS